MSYFLYCLALALVICGCRWGIKAHFAKVDATVKARSYPSLGPERLARAQAEARQAWADQEARKASEAWTEAGE